MNEDWPKDFGYGNHELEAWSALYHRYLLPLNLQVQQIAGVTNTNPKFIQRRLRHGVQLLTTKIASQEAESLECASTQRRRLLTNLPGVTISTLIGRDRELANLLANLNDDKSPSVISLEGGGGIGKTALAFSLVEEAIQDSGFMDIACLSAKREVYRGGRIEPLAGPLLTADRFLDELITQLEFGEAIGLKTEGKLTFLKKKLRESPYLIVVDNLETAEDYRGIASLIADFVGPTKILLTSRWRLNLYDYISSFEIKPLTKEATFRLVRNDALERGLDVVASSEDHDLLGVYEVTGGNPLAIKLVVGLLTHYPPAVALKRLSEAKGEESDEFFRFLYWPSWKLLSAAARKILFVLSLLPAGGAEEAILSRSDLDEDTFREGLSELIRLSLASTGGTVEKRRYTIHPLTRHFVLAEVVQKWQV